MTMEEKIARINELYHKSKETGLTEEEKEEQGRLRWDYINSIKAGIGAHLDNMSIKYPDGRQILSRINKYMVAKKIRFCNG